MSLLVVVVFEMVRLGEREREREREERKKEREREREREKERERGKSSLIFGEPPKSLLENDQTSNDQEDLFCV